MNEEVTKCLCDLKEMPIFKSLFEEMGGTYRQEGDYLIPGAIATKEL